MHHFDAHQKRPLLEHPVLFILLYVFFVLLYTSLLALCNSLPAHLVRTGYYFLLYTVGVSNPRLYIILIEFILHYDTIN